jgi:hypothetical protein
MDSALKGREDKAQGKRSAALGENNPRLKALKGRNSDALSGLKSFDTR